MHDYKRLLISLTTIILLSLLFPGRALPAGPPANPPFQIDPETLSVDLDFLEFLTTDIGVNPAPQTFSLRSADGGTHNWEAFVNTDDGDNWLALSPTAGQVADGAPQSIDVSIDLNNLTDPNNPDPFYYADITLQDIDTGFETYVFVFLEIATDASLSLDTDFLDFFALEGGANPGPQSFTLSNDGAGTLDWTATVVTDDGGAWLSLDMASGQVSTSPQAVEVSIDTTGLSEGFYFASIFIEDVNTFAESEVFVFLEIAGGNEPIPTVDPFALTFEAQAGGSNPADQTFAVQNQGTTSFDWTATPDVDWLTVNPTSGQTSSGSPTMVTASVDTTGLPSGYYYASIFLEDETTGYYEEVLVDLILSGDVTLAVSPGSLTFEATQGVISETVQTLTVTGSGTDELEWFAYNEQPWLILAYDDADYSKLHVSLDSEGLTAGVYSDTITIESNGGRKDVPVTLNVKDTRAALAATSTSAPNLTGKFTLEPANPTPGQNVIVIATVTNKGSAPVSQGFYVDFFINPKRTPTAGATDWSSIGSTLAPAQGIEWYVGNTIAPGQSVILRSDSNGTAIFPASQYTSWNGQFATGTKDLYLLVDSYAGNSSPNGSILEVREDDNLFHSTLSSGGTPPPPTQADLALTGLEVTQAVQDLLNSVPLIKDKGTFVRAHVRSNSGAVSGVTAKLKGSRNGQDLPGSPLSPINVGGSIAVKADPDRGQLNDSFLFELPSTWRSGEVTLTFEGANQQFACQESAGTANDCQATVSFVEMPTLPIKFFDVQWKDPQGNTHIPTESDRKVDIEGLIAQFPIAGLSLEVSETPLSVSRYETNGTPDLGTTIRELVALKAQKGNSYIYYYGLLNNPPTFGRYTAGLGYTPSGPNYKYYTSVGYTSRNTTSHEVGHNHARPHTGCSGQEAGPDPSYPYADGHISQVDSGDKAFYGFDIFTKRIYPPNSGDLLSYCRTSWVSDWTYKALMETIKARQKIADTPITPRAILLQAGEDALLIDGFITNSGQGSIARILDTESQGPIAAPTSGAYTLRLEDSGGQALATYSFDAINTDKGDDIFSLLLPRVAGLTRVVLLQGSQELDSRSASANPPTVTLTAPNGGETDPATVTWSANDPDGDTLNYTIDYSIDGGTSWQTLVSGWEQTDFPLDLNKIGGSNQALIRVLASDGFNTGQDQSDATFTVTNKPPQVTIANLTEKTLFIGQQTISLQGTALDLEDGRLTGSALSWTSTRNGNLGTGDTLNLAANKLKEGWHTIILTARDKNSRTSTASLAIEVKRERPTLVANMTVVPVEMEVVAQINTTQTQMAPLTIRNNGDGNLVWNASADQSWLQLNATSGTAPSELMVTIDHTGLAEGEYNGQITVTDTRTGGSQIIPITLFAKKSGNTSYMPIILK